MVENIVVDCGAYVGDTIEVFLWKTTGIMKRIYAFEPGKQQFQAMQKRVVRLKSEWALAENQIILEQAGVGEKPIFKYINEEQIGLSSNRVCDMGCDNNKIRIESLDDYFRENEDKVSFIKADIEGYELAMLKGAENLIKRCTPKLAICIYHKPNDFYEILIFIKSLVLEYKMLVKHHALDYTETILYCYV